MNIIYYHGGCPDGWAAAYIAKNKYPEAELIPLSYGEVDLERMVQESTGKDVLMVDFALKTREANDAIAFVAKSFRILDHHKTSKAILEGADYAVFDMNRSGAGLAWDYLFGYDSSWPPNKEYWNSTDIPRERPWWVEYTEDQDLWLFKLPHSRAINGWLNIQDRTVENWDQITENETPRTVESLGSAIQQFTDYMVKNAIKDLQEGVWVVNGTNHRVGIVNNGHIGTSEVGEAVYKAGYDIALMWREDGRGLMRFGLRSTTVDVGALAASFPGGGGHKNAAGFEMSLGAGRALVDELLGRMSDADDFLSASKV